MTVVIQDNPTEKQVAVAVALIYQKQGYYIISKTNYPTTDDKETDEIYNNLCETTHSNGFDFIINNGSQYYAGVEVKIQLTNQDFIRALGQCLYYMSKNDKIVKSDIFGLSCSNLNNFKSCLKKYDLPIEIKTILPYEEIISIEQLQESPSQLRSQSDISKLKLFMEVFNYLSGPTSEDVEENHFIQELTQTGKFTEDDVHNFLNKGMQNGQIYERKAGFYAKA